MPVKHAVLGLLLERRSYGYELLQRLRERLGPTWELHPASVYKALDALEADNLVRSSLRMSPSNAPGRGNRRSGLVIYEPTDEAPAALQTWLRRPVERRQPIRDELHLKLAVARPEDVAALLEVLDHEESIARRLWRQCVSEDEATLSGPAAVVRTATAARVQSELSWIRVVRSALEQLGDAGAARRSAAFSGE